MREKLTEGGGSADRVADPHRPPREGFGVGFANRLSMFGDRPAVIGSNGEVISYASLAERADEFAAPLSGSRRLVMIEVLNEVEPLVAYLGALRHNHPVLMLGPGQPGRDQVAAAYRPDVTFAKAETGWAAAVENQEAGDHHPDLALMLSTSGSTGTPKFVRLAGSALDANAEAIAAYLKLGQDDRVILNLPLHYSYGHSICSSTLAGGGCILLTDKSVIEPQFWDDFRTCGATTLAGVPYTFELLERVGFRDMALPTLRRVTEAGGRLDPELARRYAGWARDRGVDFYLMYGQTEATARMAYLEPELALDHPDAIGRPIAGGRFRLLDADGEAITASEVEGELVYAGPNVMMGYAEDRADLARGPELAELRTGDLARRDAQGLYRITGRLSRIIKPFGVRISLDEVEKLLAAQGRRAIATGDDELLVVALVGGDAGPARLKEACRFIESRLGLPAANMDVTAIAAAPLLASGKIDYRALLSDARQRRERARQRASASGGAPVEDAFRRAFPSARIMPEDTFLTLGGDSLSYVALTLDLESRLGQLPEHWETQAVAALERLAAATTSRRANWWSLVGLDSEAAVRAMAIIAVVANHAALASIAGGANVLLVLAGLSMARNNFGKLTSGAGLSIILPFVIRIIVPYYVIMMTFLIYRGSVDIGSILLIGNWMGRTQYLNSYWFLEFLFQSTVFVALAFTVPAIRRWARSSPWVFGLWVLGLSLSIRLGVAATLFKYAYSTADRAQYALFYLMALGWLVRFADTPSRKRLLTFLAVSLGVLDATGLFGLWFQDSYPRSVTRAVLMCTGCVAVIWTRSIPVPKLVRAVLAAISRFSYYIYITLAITLHALMRLPGYTPLLGLVVGIAVGVLVGEVVQSVERRALPVFGGWVAKRRAAAPEIG